MAQQVKHMALVIFILTVVVLTALSLLSVWDFVGEDVLSKSIYTIIVIAIAAIITIVVAESVSGGGQGGGKPTNISGGNF